MSADDDNNDNNDNCTASEGFEEGYANAKHEQSIEKAIAESDRKDGTFHVKGNGKGKGKADQKQLPVFPTYKYSKPTLHEAAIVSGLPFFLKYEPESGKLLTVEKIEESSRVLRPPNREEYPYTPYEFTNVEQLQRYLEVAKNETIDSLYQKAKYFVKKYNDQDECKQNLLATDIVWSYFQDKFGTTHYIGVTGENEGGKSSSGNTFESVGKVRI